MIPTEAPRAPFHQPPVIIGTVSTRAELEAFPERASVPCDVLEARLDLIGWDESGWLEACQAIEAAGTPVLLTLRLEAEGGKWAGNDTARLQPMLEAIDTLSAVDLELQSDLVPVIAERAAAYDKPIVLSFHDFQQTPDDARLRELIAEMAAYPNAIAKLALMVKGPADIKRLQNLLAENHPAPLCLIAMGDDWADTRVDFPRLGSVLTYAYLDSPSAPGQLSCEEVRERLMSDNGV